MPVDKAIVNGTLPNGIHYYVVANSDTKGMADFALVQKSGSAISEELMSCLPDLDSISPRKFFKRNGLVPKDGKYVSAQNGAAIYRFANVAISGRPVVLDSTLLVLMSMVHAAGNLETHFGQSCYAPSECAIVVSGDIEAKQIIEKIKMLSYMIPSRKSVERTEYRWMDREPSFKVIQSSKAISEIKATWALPATPKKYIGTIQPAVHNKLLNQLGYIAADRIRRELATNGIAVADINYNHQPSSLTGGDEEFGLSVVVSSDASIEAVRSISAVLSSISINGVSLAEQSYGHNWFLRKKFNESRQPIKKDDEYLDICINAFLNGAVTAHHSQLYDFYASKDVSGSVEVNLLNQMASAVFRVDKNLELTCTTAVGISADSLKSVYVSSWGETPNVAPAKFVRVSDTLQNVAPYQKLPVTSFRKEYLSGGHLWTFGNGVRVAYKRMETGGKMYWALGINGGYGNIGNLNKGEGAFVGDMLHLSTVAGMPWKEFITYQENQCVYIDTKVGLYTTVISGISDSYNLPVMMRALRAITSERRPDPNAFSEYMRQEWLRLEGNDGSSLAIIDSLVCSGYKYSPIKTSGKVSYELFEKSNELFEKLFSKVNNGIIVLVGDVEESALRKQLREYLGGFATNKFVSTRPLVSYQPTSGSMTHLAEGEAAAVYLAASVPMPFTLKNYITSEIAGALLNNYITTSLVDTGLCAKVVWDLRMAPYERFSVLIELDDERALDAVYAALSPDGVSSVVDSQIDACKQWMKNNHNLRMKSPQYWVNVMTLRYLEGKDMTSGYDKELDNVDVEMVKGLFVRLNDVNKVEYIIRKR